MTARRWLLAALVLAMALSWLGCQSSSTSSNGTLAPYYVKGQGYNPAP